MQNSQLKIYIFRRSCRKYIIKYDGVYTKLFVLQKLPVINRYVLWRSSRDNASQLCVSLPLSPSTSEQSLLYTSLARDSPSTYASRISLSGIVCTTLVNYIVLLSRIIILMDPPSTTGLRPPYDRR